MLFEELIKQSLTKLGWVKPTLGQLVGLDVGSDNLKLLQINQSDSGYLIEKMGMVETPEGAIVKDEIKNAQAIGAALRDMVREVGLLGRDVAVAIPRSLAIIKTINVDKRLGKDDIESRAWIEANRHFPDLVGDIYLDFVVTGPAPQEDSQLEVILVACRKEQIKPYLEILKEGGMVPVIVDVNSYALERALRVIMKQNQQLETVALLNINKSLSTFIVVNKQAQLLAHDQSYDGKRLLTQVKGYLKDKPLDSSSSDIGLINDAEYVAILKESLISHLRHTLHFFYSSRPNVNLQKIILAGDCAVVPDLALFIQNEIGIETQLANPFQGMEVASNINKNELSKSSAAMMLACGLALSQREAG